MFRAIPDGVEQDAANAVPKPAGPARSTDRSAYAGGQALLYVFRGRLCGAHLPSSMLRNNVAVRFRHNRPKATRTTVEDPMTGESIDEPPAWLRQKLIAPKKAKRRLNRQRIESPWGCID